VLSESAYLAPRSARLVDVADAHDALDRAMAAAYGWPEEAPRQQSAPQAPAKLFAFSISCDFCEQMLA
jgi:hypothetical protein